MENFELSSIEEAIKDFKEGKFVIVVMMKIEKTKATLLWLLK